MRAQAVAPRPADRNTPNARGRQGDGGRHDLQAERAMNDVERLKEEVQRAHAEAAVRRQRLQKAHGALHAFRDPETAKLPAAQWTWNPNTEALWELQQSYSLPELLESTRPDTVGMTMLVGPGARGARGRPGGGPTGREKGCRHVTKGIDAHPLLRALEGGAA
jgi:hypothetical protein